MGCGIAGHHDRPDQKQLTQAVKAFLADHGDLCMAKYTWPRDVTPGDEKTDPNDAVQLPVLERLGVVQSVEIPAPKTAAIGATAAGAPAEPAKRYSLTEKGRQILPAEKAHDHRTARPASRSTTPTSAWRT